MHVRFESVLVDGQSCISMNHSHVHVREKIIFVKHETTRKGESIAPRTTKNKNVMQPHAIVSRCNECDNNVSLYFTPGKQRNATQEAETSLLRKQPQVQE